MWKDGTKGETVNLSSQNGQFRASALSVTAGVQNCFSIFEPLRNFQSTESVSFQFKSVQLVAFDKNKS